MQVYSSVLIVSSCVDISLLIYFIYLVTCISLGNLSCNQQGLCLNLFDSIDKLIFQK